jgi:hypothetical protein
VTPSTGKSRLSKLRRTVYGKLEMTDFRQLRQEASARGVTLTVCVADCLREYFALRHEMATAVTTAGEPGGRHTGLIHSLLARSEERLAATVDAQVGQVVDDLRLVASMLDRFVQLYLLHTPEVARELHAGAMASANRRYANYRQAVSDLLASGGVNGGGARPASAETETP